MKTNRVTAFVLLGALAACRLVDRPRDESALRFSVSEVDWFSDAGPGNHIVLQVMTEKEYSCMNYQLESELAVSGRLVQVGFTGNVTIGQVCLTAFGPARFVAALPLTDGVYTFEFSRGGATDRYQVTVSAAAIEITPVGLGRFTRPTAARFPRTS
jgi:hypothetical protein